MAVPISVPKIKTAFDQFVFNKSQVVRIFTSSTFTDMLMERNTLMEFVYPRVREYCRERYGIEFQVDVRCSDQIIMQITMSMSMERWWTCDGECGTR